MAVQSNLKNMVLCLTAVCLVCSAILGCIYVVTLEPIKNTNHKILIESIGKVMPNGGEISQAIPAIVGGVASEYYTSTKDGKINAYAVKSQVNGFGGPLVIMVGILSNGIIYNTSVLSQNETPGLGAKCDKDPKFVNQWKGFNPVEKKLAVTKDGGNVDAITASTITSRAYTLAVKNAVEFVDSLKSKQE